MYTMYKRALARIDSAEYMISKALENDRCKDIAAFDIQQAIEFLCIQICRCKDENSDNTHDIRHHANRLYNLGDRSEAVRKVSNIAEKVYGWEVNSRYQDEFTVQIEDLQLTLMVAKELAEHVNHNYISKVKVKAYIKLMELSSKYDVSIEDLSKFYQYIKCGVVVNHTSNVLIDYAINNIDDLLNTLKDSDFI